MMGPMMYGPYGGGIWMFLNFLLWILIIIGVILLIVWLVRQPGRYPRGREEETAVEILKKRYARGEISKEDYDRMRKDIS